MTAFTVLSGPSHGQAPPSGSAFYTAQAVRIDSARAPIIDGDLSDPAWSQATIIDEFYQRNPNFGEPATERTVLRIMYDENNLYIGVYSYDSTPDEIVVRAMARDGPTFNADFVRVTLDPGLTRRNGYALISTDGTRFGTRRFSWLPMAGWQNFLFHSVAFPMIQLRQNGASIFRAGFAIRAKWCAGRPISRLAGRLTFRSLVH